MLHLGLPLACMAVAAAAQDIAARPPKLAVVLVIDQMRADYLDRFEPWFGKRGFRRVFAEGARATQAFYQHALTHTGPGHAVIGSGVLPRDSGIIANTWLDPKTLRGVYCVADGTSRSPKNLRTETFGDRWKRKFGAKARVVSFSVKDRAAICLGGHLADGVYWFNLSNGDLVTSPYYTARRDLAASSDRVARFIKRLNGLGVADRWRGKVWRRSIPPGTPEARALYARLAPDDRADELPPRGVTRTFPHAMVSDKVGYYSGLVFSAFGNDFVLDVASRAVADLGLGRGDAPDLLLVSVSSLDYVGHAFGPDSHEVMDTVLRLDRALAGFLAMLDTRVGKGRWTLALSSDHGVGRIPTRARELTGSGGFADIRHYDPSHPDQEGLLVRLSRHLAEWFGDDLPAGFKPIRFIGSGAARAMRLTLFAETAGQVYLRPNLARLGLDRAKVASEAATWLRLQGEVGYAIGRPALTGKLPDHPYARLFCMSFDPSVSGDVMFCLAPHTLPWKRGTMLAASHGTPHDYDRHVPLLFLGKGVARGVRYDEPCHVADLVGTLADICGVPVPEHCTGRSIGAFRRR